MNTGGSLSIHQVLGTCSPGGGPRCTAGTIDWAEGTITANNAPGIKAAAEETVTGITKADKNTYITFDITNLVKDWVNSLGATNNGVAIKSAGLLQDQQHHRPGLLTDLTEPHEPAAIWARERTAPGAFTPQHR